MNCPKCQVENRDRAKFCKDCGTNLETPCSECGTVYELGSNFCDECGHSLAQESQINKTEPTSDSERKHVTVLFSDISGYTAMSEKLDPEEVKEITTRIFGEVSNIVANYDGFIEKYAGDAVMAIFGVFEQIADHTAVTTYAHRLWDFFRDLFLVSFSTIFDIFKINDDFQPYLDALSDSLTELSPFQGCET